MLANKRVLVVDDSNTIRMFVRTLLEAKGSGVHEAEDGAAALALCGSAQPYDLVILDLILPDMHGIDILTRIRQGNDTSTIVMLTEVGGAKSAIAAVQHGADGYIEKRELSAGGDFAEFFYSLRQAMEHRAGLIAQKQLQMIRADFYSMVTHDLRNPAGAAVLAISLLMDEQGDPLTAQQREVLGMAEVAADKLLCLINDYLDYAKLDAGYLKLHPVSTDLRELIESGAGLQRFQARAKYQVLSIDLPPDPIQACVDGGLLKQILDNLLSNAVKYTPEGGHIAVQLRAEGEAAILSVADDGQGIPPSELPALFTKYHRVPGEATRGIRGSGLGLLIVKEIVEAHGGAVSAESAGPGQGSIFTVRIPLHREPAAAWAVELAPPDRPSISLEMGAARG